ncbi:hypothetical protein JB92DRAFT_1953245 [Gautieria morchelliformis]|nr:hypothetical protein JB92DRAFT_1953245 [Gautieria morchelliformis]
MSIKVPFNRRPLTVHHVVFYKYAGVMAPDSSTRQPRGLKICRGQLPLPGGTHKKAQAETLKDRAFVSFVFTRPAKQDSSRHRRLRQHSTLASKAFVARGHAAAPPSSLSLAHLYPTSRITLLRHLIPTWFECLIPPVLQSQSTHSAPTRSQTKSKSNQTGLHLLQDHTRSQGHPHQPFRPLRSAKLALSVANYLNAPTRH